MCVVCVGWTTVEAQAKRKGKETHQLRDCGIQPLRLRVDLERLRVRNSDIATATILLQERERESRAFVSVEVGACREQVATLRPSRQERRACMLRCTNRLLRRGAKQHRVLTDSPQTHDMHLHVREEPRKGAVQRGAPTCAADEEKRWASVCLAMR